MLIGASVDRNMAASISDKKALLDVVDKVADPDCTNEASDAWPNILNYY